MPRKDTERRAAIALRERGMSVRRIADELGVAKSSVSVWVRDVPRGGRLPSGAEPMPARIALPLWTSGRIRRCGRCGLELPDVCFNRRGDDRQWWCRECYRAYFRERGRTHIEQSLAALARRRERARQVLLAFLRTHGCRDCGEQDVVVLECDHVRVKRHTVATLVRDGAPVAVIERELAECEVVCANCHRRRTARRADWLRHRATWRAELERRGDPVARNTAHIYEALEASGCVDCGIRDLTALEFDHIGPKRDKVTRLASTGASLETLDRELAQCEVVCANCHRRRTAHRGGHYRARQGAPGAGAT